MFGTVALLPLLPSCEDRTRSLVIASHHWPGYELLFLAADEEWLPRNEIRLIETASATNALQMLRAGELHGATMTLDEMLRLRDEGIALAVVLVIDESAGSDVLLVRPGIRSLAALAGKRIGVEQTALGAFMLHRVLEAAKIRPQELTILSVTWDQHVAAWRDGRIDAVITYEPVATKIEAFGAVRLFDSRQISGAIVDVLAIRQKALRTHAGSIRSLVYGHFRARQHLLVNPQDAAYHMAKGMGIAPKDVIKAFRGIELPGVRRNREFLDGKAPALVETAEALSAVMTQAGLLKRPAYLAGLVRADFLPAEEL